MKPRRFEPEDLLDFSLVADVQLSPDGERVVYAVKTIDRDKDLYATRLWLVSADGGEPRRFTTGAWHDTSPRWSPDGRRIAFVSSRTGVPQLHVIDLDGGEARQVTALPEGTQKPAWSPDGRALLFVARTPVERRPDDIPEERWNRRPRVVTRAFYKLDGAGYTLDQRAHLYTVPATGGAVEQLTRGDADDSAPAWSPDGRSVAFVRARTGRHEAHRTDLWRMNADGSEARRLTRDLPKITAPAWSPDGRTIACHGSAIDGDARTQVWLVDAETGAHRRLGGDDLEIASYPLDNGGPPFWIDDGRALVVLQASGSTSRPVRLDVGDGRTHALVHGERQSTMISVAAQAGRLAFSCSDVERFCEISVAALDGSGERRVARPNAAWAAGRVALDMRKRSFTADDGAEITGWLVLPRTRGDGPRPLWVDLHGGPHSYVELGYPYHPYWHVLASRGWAVLALDAVGSSSYGKGYAERLRGHWGERDLPQHLQAIARLVEEGVVDDRRIAVGGKSYGGYLAAWAIGQTQRFRAAVVSAPVADLISHFGTSDSGYYVTPFAMAGEVWQARETYQRLSPVEYLERATTPTLILQGEDDQRCPIGQAEEVFATLVRAGHASAEFVRYPGGDHHLAEQGAPSHRVDYTRRIVEWVERWTAGDPPT